MYTFNNGFSITYDVGTYRIFDNGHGLDYIVSDEYSSEVNKKPQIPTKTQQFDYPNNSLEILIEFANVDATNFDSILKYCNKYGLPVSSSYMDKKYKGIYRGDYINNLEEYKKINPFWDHDNMSVIEFIDIHTNVSNLLYLRYALDSKNRDTLHMLQVLFSVLLFYYEKQYNFNFHNEFPTTIVSIYQYLFIRYKRSHDRYTLAQTMIEFVNARKCHIDSLVDDSYVDYFKSINGSEIILFDCFDNFLLELAINNPSIQVDEMRRVIKFNKEIKITPNLLELGNYLLPIILTDIINERLHRIHPLLCYNDSQKCFSAKWDWTSQLDGIMVELLLNLAGKYVVKKCANPSCNYYFIPQRENRIYCCRECGIVMAKRRQRQREKEATHIIPDLKETDNTKSDAKRGAV